MGPTEVCVWQEFGFSRSEYVSTFIYITKKFDRFCTFNATCKDNAAVLLFNRKETLIPVNFYGSYYTSNAMKQPHAGSISSWQCSFCSSERFENAGF